MRAPGLITPGSRFELLKSTAVLSWRAGLIKVQPDWQARDDPGEVEMVIHS